MRLKDGRFQAQTPPLPNGKRKALYGKTKAQAADKMNAFLRKQGLIALSGDGSQTLADYLESWLEQVVRPSVRPSTYRSYELHVREHIRSALGLLSVATLGPHHVQGFMNQLASSGLSAQTVHNIRATLRNALAHAVRWRLIDRNVAIDVRLPKRPTRRPPAMTPDQAEAFLAAVRGHRLEALYTVAVSLGLRQGEALGLEWPDIDLENRTLTVCRALQRVDGKLTFVLPKSDESRRTIALPDIAVQALRRHRAHQGTERLLAVGRWTESKLVFSTSIGTPLDGPNVTRMLQRLMKAAGLPPSTFHQLRHDCATLLVAQGVPIRVVADVLGHSDPSLTLRTYAHVSAAQHRAAADSMDAAIHDKERKG